MKVVGFCSDEGSNSFLIIDYLRIARMEDASCYGEISVLRQNVSMGKRMRQKEELLGKIGYAD